MSMSPFRRRPGFAMARRRRRVRAAAVVVVLLIVVALAASLATRARAEGAAAELRLSKSAGPPGSPVVVSGRGYQALETVDVHEDTTLWATVQADATGAFSLHTKICSCFGPATIQVKGTGESSGLSAQAPFTITTPWPQFRMTPDHTGDNRFENVISTFSASAMLELWSGPTNNFFSYSTAVVSGGDAYVGSGDQNLYVFDAFGCGQQTVCPALWTGATGGYIDSTPAVGSNLVLVASTDAKLYAFPAQGCGQATCQPVWTATTGFAIHASPTVAGKFVYLVSGDGLLHVYRAAGCGSSTCQDVWTGTLNGLIPTGSSAAVSGGMVFVGAGDSVLAFDSRGCGQAQCSPLWATPTGGNVFSSPAVAAGVVYAGSEDHSLYALDAATGAVLWTAPTGDVIEASPAVRNGLVYVGSFDGGVYAFHANGCGQATCSPVWDYGTQGPIFSSPAVANDVLF